MNKNVLIVIGGATAVNAAFTAYYIYKCKKLQEYTAVKLDSVSRVISDGVEVEIPKDVVEKAVKRASNDKANDMVDRAAVKIANDIRDDMHYQIDAAISDIHDDMRGKVEKKFEEDLSKIDIDKITLEIKQDTISRTSKSIEEKLESSVDKKADELTTKFDDKLEDLLDKYNKDLDRVNTIYKSISKAITPTETGDSVIFK